MSRTQKPSKSTIVYPDRDGKRMADDTLQYQWIVTIEGHLEILFTDRPDVFIAGDLLWYPVEGDPAIRTAPDAMVAFGRPKGYRGSYKQWEEGGGAPQVVFEVLSHRNRAGEMQCKFDLYNRYGVLEYYIYDPHKDALKVHVRDDRGLAEADVAETWTSPLLGIVFDRTTSPLTIRHPDGRPFLSFKELGQECERLACERALAERDRQRARADQLAAKLREPGIDPG